MENELVSASGMQTKKEKSIDIYQDQGYVFKVSGKFSVARGVAGGGTKMFSSPPSFH